MATGKLFRVGRVTVYLRGKVWYLRYHENGTRRQVRGAIRLDILEFRARVLATWGACWPYQERRWAGAGSLAMVSGPPIVLGAAGSM